MWRIDYGYIEEWLDRQDAKTVAAVFAALEVLEREGPSLGRPLVDSLAGGKGQEPQGIAAGVTRSFQGENHIRVRFREGCDNAARWRQV